MSLVYSGDEYKYLPSRRLDRDNRKIIVMVGGSADR